MPTIICKEFKFEAAHQLPHHHGKCSRPHGHSYKLFVYAKGEPLSVDPEWPQSDEGMVMDFAELKTIVNEEIVDVCDHQDLNVVLADHVPVTTAECMVDWMLRTLRRRDDRIFKVRLFETASSYAEVEV